MSKALIISKKLLQYKYIRIYLLTVMLTFLGIKLAPTIGQFHISAKILVAISVTQFTLAIGVLIAAMRYYVLLNNPANNFSTIIKSILLGFGLSILLPGRVGELLRPTYLFQHSKINIQIAIAALSVEKSLDIVAVLIFGLIFLSARLIGHHVLLYSLITMLILLPLLLLSRIEPLLRKVIAWIPISKISTFLNVSLDSLLSCAKSHLLIKSIIMTTIIWIVSACSTYIYFGIALTGQHLGFATTTSILILSIIGGTIPLLPGGFGLFEAATVYVLQQYGYPLSYALVIAIGYHISQILLTSVLGLFIAYREKTGTTTLLKASFNKFKTKSKQRS